MVKASAGYYQSIHALIQFNKIRKNNLQVHVKLLPCCKEVGQYSPIRRSPDFFKKFHSFDTAVRRFKNYVVQNILYDAESHEEHDVTENKY